MAIIYPGDDLLSHALSAHSTIGPAGLNFRVRDGNGCFPCGMITGKSMSAARIPARILNSPTNSKELKQRVTLNSIGRSRENRFLLPRDLAELHRSVSILQFSLHAPSKFYGQAERAISTGKLNASLHLHIQPIKQVVFLCPSSPLRVGRSHLGVCFTLICIQRLSQPNFATQPCR